MPHLRPILNQNSRMGFEKYVPLNDIVCTECSGPTCTLIGLKNAPFTKFQEDPGTACASATNVCYELVWKDLPFSELRAPLDKEEKGRLIKE